MKNKSLSKNVILNCIKALMKIVFPLISFPYASRILMPSGLGKVNFASSVISYFVLFASLGISTYGVRNGSKLRDDKDKLSIFTQEIFIINLFTTILTYIVFIAMLYLVPKFNEYQFILIITSLNIICTPLGLEWLYGAIEEYEYITIRSIIFQFISLILLFLFVRDSNDILQYAFVTIFASVGSNILNLIHSRKFISWKKYEIRQYNFLQHLKPILIIFGLNLACNIYMNLDKTMLGIMIDDYEVGLYTAAYKINSIILSFINAAGAVLLPRMSYYINNGQTKEYKNLFFTSFNIVLVLSIPATVGLIVLSPELISLLSGEQYLSAVPTMKVLSLLILISGMGTTFSVQLFVARGKEQVCLLASTFAAITNLVANWLLIPYFGALGAAFGTIICEIVALIICLLFASKDINLKILYKNAYQYVLASVLIVIFVNMVKTFSFGLITTIIISVLISVLIYFMILILFKNEYVMELVNMIKNKVQKIL